MQLQRNVILIALAVVAYLLFYNWQQDYGQQPSAVQSETVASSTAAPANNAAPAAANAGDIAGLTPAATQAARADIPASASATTNTRVSVRTDVFDLEIDLTGGDIVSLKLPRYGKSLETPDIPFQLMSSGATTYLAQSGLVSTLGPDLPTGVRGTFTASASRYELTGDTLEVVLEAPVSSGVSVQKIFRFKRGDYLIDVRYRVVNQGGQAWSGFLFGQIKRDASGDPSHPDSGGMLSATPTYLGAAYASQEKAYNKLSLGDIQEKPLQLDTKGGWIAFIQHYFLGAWIPSKDDNNRYTTRFDSTNNMYLLGFTSPQVTVAPGETREVSARFYAGPKVQEVLEQISPGLDLTVDYGWFWMISQGLFWALVQFEKLFGNWGVAIILLTLSVKLLLYYPSQVSYRSMAHMRRITPELTRIREEYKNDRQKQSMEMLALYRKEKINPLGGCLPILLQMPVFIALYWVLLESVELRQAPFMLWIKDLSVMDPYFVLPLLMGASMWIQTHLNPPPPDPMQAKVMKWLPVIFTFFFLFFASGLVLYWLVNNVLSILQQWYITRQIENEYAKKT